MVYKPDIPVSGIAPATQRSEIQENFSQLDMVDDVDHYKFSSTEPYIGMHKAMRFREQADDPETLPDQIGLYAKQDPGSNLVYYARGQDDGLVIPLSNPGGGGGSFWNPSLQAGGRFDNTPALLGTSNNLAGVTKSAIAGSFTRPRFRYKVTFTSAIPENLLVSVSYVRDNTSLTIVVNEQTTSYIEFDAISNNAGVFGFNSIQFLLWEVIG